MVLENCLVLWDANCLTPAMLELVLESFQD